MTAPMTVETPRINQSKYRIVLVGLAVHILLLSAVFDVYFSSPLDHGMTPHRSTRAPPAKRLVLFVADGLRAQALFGEENQDRAPFLTGILKNNGSWGVAHTRVPTESRPGHVALLAGIYEDPSAILKGWKANPINFDSVINESSNAWCWGSPDIVDIFNKDHLPHIRLFSYDSSIEDFGKNDTFLLDAWVFERVNKFLKQEVATCQQENCPRYDQQGNFYFLHLLGIDTAGHAYKPHSREYIQNIKLVDENVKKTYELFEETYPDRSTAYIFTSDHGMTDWGSHGAGSLHETKVPIIAWGAGIKIKEDRQDINQIDIAPLMAALIGINIPTNSLGVLPYGYIETDLRNLVRMHNGNALQLLEIFNVKRRRIQDNALMFVSYKLSIDVEYYKMLYKNGKFEDVIKESRRNMRQLIAGVNYYHNYYQYPVLISVSLGFLGWILLLVFSVLGSNRKSKGNRSSRNAFIASIVISAIVCCKHRFPFTYYLYFSFPIAIANFLVQDSGALTIFIKIFKSDAKNKLINLLIYSVGIELLIYGFFQRTLFSLLTLLVGLWIFVSKSLYDNTGKREKLSWLLQCIGLACFPCFPVMKTTFSTMLFLIGCFIWLMNFYHMHFNVLKFYKKMENAYIQYRIFYMQFFCFMVAIGYILAVEYRVIPSDSPLKYISWLLLVVPVCLIPLSSRFVVIRLISTFFAFAPFYVMVSPSYELPFCAVYVSVLFTWLQLECATFLYPPNIIYRVNFDKYSPKTKLDADMLRRCFSFMVFIFVGFFGTGNIASLNSFDPMWVRAFLTVFSPFKMTGLVLLKIMVPFIFACCIFRAINFLGRESVWQTFCTILIFSDLMVLQFLYLITNVGSWLDIGTSLSHFIIMEAFVTILLLLYGFAYLVTTVTYF